jgi:hypothetical protein
MEELADALQDASFIGAISDPDPKPMGTLPLPTATEVRATLRAAGASRQPVFEEVLQEPLGWHFFRDFLEEVGAAALLDFVADTEAYARVRSTPGLRLARAHEIVSTYFQRRPDAAPFDDTDPGPEGFSAVSSVPAVGQLASVQPGWATPVRTIRIVPQMVSGSYGWPVQCLGLRCS